MVNKFRVSLVYFIITTLEEIKYTQKANSIQRDKCVVFLQQRHIVLPGQNYKLFWNYNTCTPEDSLVFPQFAGPNFLFSRDYQLFSIYIAQGLTENSLVPSFKSKDFQVFSVYNQRSFSPACLRSQLEFNFSGMSAGNSDLRCFSLPVAL